MFLDILFGHVFGVLLALVGNVLVDGSPLPSGMKS